MIRLSGLLVAFMNEIDSKPTRVVQAHEDFDAGYWKILLCRRLFR